MAPAALQQQLVSRVASAAVGTSASTRQGLAAPAQIQTPGRVQGAPERSAALLRVPASSRVVRRHTKPLVLAASASEVASETQQVEFVLVKECRFGQAFFVVGSGGSLGEWDVTKALPMEWHEGHVWRASTTMTEEEKAGLEFKFVMLGKRGEVEWQPTDNMRPGDGRGTDVPCTQREGLLILHRPWAAEGLGEVPVYAPNAPSTNGATNGVATNGAAANGAATNGAATNGAAASVNGSATSKDKQEEGEKEEKAWGKNVLSQLLRSWGRKTLMDEEKSGKGK